TGEEADNWCQFPAMSHDARFVAFTSMASNLVPGDTNDIADVFVYDRWHATQERVSVDTDGTQATFDPELNAAQSISADGRFVVCRSKGVFAGDVAPWQQDIFVRDRDVDDDGIFDEPGAVATILVSVSSAGIQADGYSFDPTISADGRFVVFGSAA